MLTTEQRREAYQRAFTIASKRKETEVKIEAITKSAQTADLLVQDLREAIKASNAVENIVILKAIEDAVQLRSRLQQLLTAMTNTK